MATLASTKIKDRYQSLLKLEGTANETMPTGSVLAVEDGAGNDSSLALGSDRCTITLGSDAGDDFIVDTNVLVVEGDNNRVGIGVTDPATKLEVFATTEQLRLSYDADSFASFTVANSSNLTIATGESGTITISDATAFSDTVTLAQNKKLIFDSTDTYIMASTDSAETLTIAADDDIILDPDDDLIIQVGTTEYVRFDGANTRVGIGVNDPDTKLEVFHNGTQVKLSYDASNYATLAVGSGGDLTVAPSGGDVIMNVTDVLVNQYIKHNGDEDTFLNFADDDLTITVGNEQFIKMTEDGSQDIITIGDAGDIDFKVSAGIANALFVQGSDGNVGIGTGAPSQILHITSGTSAKPVVLIENTTADATGATIQLHSQRNASATDASDADVMGTISFTGYDDGTPSTQTYGSIVGSIVDASSGAEQGKITFNAAEYDGTLTEGMALIGGSSDGLVSLSIGGYATPADMVHVQDGDITIMTNNTSNTAANYLKFYKSGHATDGNNSTIVADDEYLGGLLFYGADGDSWALAAGMRAVVNGTPGDGDMPGSLEFYTSADGAESLTTQLVINNAGLATFTGAVTVGGVLTTNSTATINDDVTIVEGKKIIFDSADTYIYANTDNPEDLVVGADADIILEPDANVGIGVSDPDTKLEVFHGGTQMKLSYDADSFATMAVDNSSNLTIATGESGTIAFSDAISVTAGNATLTDGNLVITAADHGIIHTNSGTVTQGTSITTGVTLNTTSGVITMHATAIAADENIEFTVTNSTVQADSVILMTMQDENTVDNTQLVCATHTITGGSFKITVANTDSAQASSATAVKIHFLVINNS